MLPTLWDGLTGKLAEHFTSRVVAPAFVFWAGGLIAWVVGNPWNKTGRHGQDTVLNATEAIQRQPALLQVVVVIAVVLLLSGSAVLGDLMTLPVLRILEGYGWPRSLTRRRKKYIQQRRQRLYTRWNDLMVKRESEGLHDIEAAELDLLDEQLHHLPAIPELTMPTRLGNLLRVSETGPRIKYGLGMAVWPTLWPLLDKDLRDELTQARGALNAGTRLWLWSALFSVWTIWAWWPLPIALLACTVTYYGVMLRAAQTYGDLVEAAFEINRTRLYQALRWPLPPNPYEECEEGQKLTAYLTRGSVPPGITFKATDS